MTAIWLSIKISVMKSFWSGVLVVSCKIIIKAVIVLDNSKNIFAGSKIADTTMVVCWNSHEFVRIKDSDKNRGGAAEKKSAREIRKARIRHRQEQKDALAIAAAAGFFSKPYCQKFSKKFLENYWNAFDEILYRYSNTYWNIIYLNLSWRFLNLLYKQMVLERNQKIKK